MTRNVKQIISKAIDEVYPNISKDEKAIILTILKGKVQKAIEETMRLVREAKASETIKTLILTSMINKKM